MVALGFSSIIALYIYRKLSSVGFLICLIVSFLITIFGQSSAAFFLRGQTAEEMANLTGRLFYWQAGWKMAQESFLFGHGFYTAHELAAGRKVTDEHSLQLRPVAGG